jgi:hypothetical protein
MRHSHAEKKFKCHYENCEKKYYYEYKLKEHIAIAHTREYLYVCRVPGCGKQFRIHHCRNIHEKRMHKEEYARVLRENKTSCWRENIPFTAISNQDSQASDSNEMQAANSANLSHTTAVKNDNQMETQMAVRELQNYGNVMYEQL